MTKIIDKLQKPLTAHEIDFRVQSINKGGYATILAYKDARVDMKRLDEVFGVCGWQRDYKTVGNLMLCGISIWDSTNKQWVTKWDTGTESNTEAAKGLASDSFKRACFNLGIGRELYSYPVIQIKLHDKEMNKKGDKVYASWDFKLKEWTWLTEFTEGELNFIAAKDDKGAVRFTWGELDQDGKRLRQMFKTSFGVGVDDINACLAMHEVSECAGDQLWKELIDFDKDKTKNKKLVASMHSKGAATLNASVENYKEHMKNDDELGMKEIIDDLPEFHKTRLLECVQ